MCLFVECCQHRAAASITEVTCGAFASDPPPPPTRKKYNKRVEIREMLARRIKAKEKEEEIYGGLREEIGMNTYLHGPMDYAKTLKLRFRVGNLDLPERRKRYTST